MKIAFLLIAAAMTAAALYIVLRPLLRTARTHGNPRRMVVLALAVAVALPVGVVGIYAMVGTPAALNGVARQPEPPKTIDEALAQLTAHLAAEPNDVAGWMLLAQTRTMLRQPAAARDAYDQALKAAPNNVDAMVGWAESDSLTRSDHLLEGRALELLKRAVALKPDSQRGLWLLGISDFQHARYRDAEATWRLLQPQLEPGSDVAKAVAEQIALASARANGTPAATTPGAAKPGATATGTATSGAASTPRNPAR